MLFFSHHVIFLHLVPTTLHFQSMATDRERALTSSRRRGGVVRASVTKLGTKLTELEGKTEDPSTLSHAQHLSSRLDSLDSEFKTHHYSVVDLIVNDDELESEQNIIYQHDDTSAELSLRIQKLVSICSHCSTDPSTPRNLQARKLERLEKELSDINSAVDSLDKVTNNTC